MSETWRMALFLVVVLSVWTLLHAYVFWSVGRAPLVAENLPRRLLLVVAAALWLTYPLGRILDRPGPEAVSFVLELVGAVWMGVLFLAFVGVLLADLVRGLVLLTAPVLGRLAAPADVVSANLPLGAVALALALATIGLVQQVRGPVVVEHEVHLAGLPVERDGTVLVAISDLHLGSLLGARWFERRLAQIEPLRADLVAVVGDLVDGSAARVESLLPQLRRLRAPLGVWAVPGNHEHYAGLERCTRLLEEAGYTVLRGRWAEVAPGLVVAGADDLTAVRQLAPRGTPGEPLLAGALDAALAGRPPGATVLLSHTPWLADRAAAHGVALMLSGHTHDGQIWPFGGLVRLQYPYLAGSFTVGGMRLIVGRGTGTWGPPLRLWRRSEILRITLRAAAPASPLAPAS